MTYFPLPPSLASTPLEGVHSPPSYNSASADASPPAYLPRTYSPSSSPPIATPSQAQQNRETNNSSNSNNNGTLPRLSRDSSRSHISAHSHLSLHSQSPSLGTHAHRLERGTDTSPAALSKSKMEKPKLGPRKKAFVARRPWRRYAEEASLL